MIRMAKCLPRDNSIRKHGIPALDTICESALSIGRYLRHQPYNLLLSEW